MEAQQVAALLWPNSASWSKQTAHKPDEAVSRLVEATDHASLTWSGPCDAICAQPSSVGVPCTQGGAIPQVYDMDQTIVLQVDKKLTDQQ